MLQLSVGSPLDYQPRWLDLKVRVCVRAAGLQRVSVSRPMLTVAFRCHPLCLQRGRLSIYQDAPLDDQVSHPPGTLPLYKIHLEDSTLSTLEVRCDSAALQPWIRNLAPFPRCFPRNHPIYTVFHCIARVIPCACPRKLRRRRATPRLFSHGSSLFVWARTACTCAPPARRP